MACAPQIRRLIELASITSNDIVCDLGFGDGSLLCSILELTGCCGIGCEIDGSLVLRARTAPAVKRLGSRLELTEALILPFMESAKFSRATVCFVFLVPQQLAQMLPALHAFLSRPGTRVLAERFEVAGLCCTGRISAIADDTSDALGYFSGRGSAFLYECEQLVAAKVDKSRCQTGECNCAL